MNTTQPSGMRTFTIIWAGQLLSLIGTAMTRFALVVWAYDLTGTATTVALVSFSFFLPLVLISPIAGIVVDRFDRRMVMLVTDLGAGVMTLVLLALHLSGSLAVWHAYLLLGASGIFNAFQEPAYVAASSLLVPKTHYARANGMRSIAESSSQLFAPFMAALLLPVAGLTAVMLVDVATFLFAVVTLVMVRVPAPPQDDPITLANWRQQTQTGFRFIAARGGLIGLIIVFMGMNFMDTLTYSSLLPVTILGKTGGDEFALAWVSVALGVGGIIGGVLVSMFGLPKRMIHGMLAFAAVSFIFGDTQIGMGDSLWRWSLGALAAAVFIPAIVSANTTIWQRKTPPSIQGRVFAVKNMIQQAPRPIGFLISGPLADRVFEPAMAPGGALADVFGPWVGTGPGAGVALMFVCTGVIGCTMALSGYLFPAVRNVEDDLPDCDTVIAETPPTEAIVVS
ncbi:MAG: MFS transporter [Chloroflexota bacterium]